MRIATVSIALLGLSVLAASSLRAGVRAGRALGPDRDAAVHVSAGAILSVQGSVQETSRLFYTVTGRDASQLTREDYDLEDFGMDGGYATFGLATETAWKYVTLETEFLFFEMDTRSTAGRNYYIGVDSVDFGGTEYDYMQIPVGRSFAADLTGFLLDLRGLITPCTFEVSDSFAATPWLSVGVFVLAGTYDIDAGPATGLIQYQNPPETFVVGGRADGTVGGGLPELGLGGELRFGRADALHLVVRGNAGFCRYSGSTDWLTTADHREKDIDLDHLNLKAACRLEIPLDGGRAISVGARLQRIDTEATITSRGGTTEEILARRERFDKEVDFEMLMAVATVGLRF